MPSGNQFHGLLETPILSSSMILPSMLDYRRVTINHYSHRIHGAAIYGNMGPINIPQMLAYIPAPWILWD